MKKFWIVFFVLLLASFAYGQGTQHTTGQIDDILTTIEPGLDGDLSDDPWWIRVNALVTNNLDATSDPLPGDDLNDGYSIGSTWINTTTKKIFFCLDNTVGAAVWYDPADEGFANPMDGENQIIVGSSGGSPVKLAGSPNAVLGWNASGVIGAYQNNSMNDAAHQIYDNTDPTKKVRIVADNLNSGQQVDLEVPNKSGKLAYEERETGTLAGGSTIAAADCYNGQKHYLTTAGTFTMPSLQAGMDCWIHTIGGISGTAAPYNSSQSFMYMGSELAGGATAPNNSTAGEYWHFTYYDSDTWYLQTNIGGAGGGAVTTQCLAKYAADVNNDQPVYLGNSSYTAFAGGMYTPQGDQDVCKVDVFIKAIVSSGATLPSNQNYHAKIYSINQTTYAIVSELGVSTAVDGEALLADNWASDGDDYFYFNSKPTLSDGVKYVILFFVDTDGNLNDQPEWTAGDYPQLAYQNENGTNMGRIFYQADLTLNTYELDDPVKIKVYTDQVP